MRWNFLDSWKYPNEIPGAKILKPIITMNEHSVIKLQNNGQTVGYARCRSPDSLWGEWGGGGVTLIYPPMAPCDRHGHPAGPACGQWLPPPLHTAHHHKLEWWCKPCNYNIAHAFTRLANLRTARDRDFPQCYLLFPVEYKTNRFGCTGWDGIVVDTRHSYNDTIHINYQ